MEYVRPHQLHIVHIWHLITCSDPVWTEFFLTPWGTNSSVAPNKNVIVECKMEAAWKEKTNKQQQQNIPQ